jgi:hypothetical protein
MFERFTGHARKAMALQAVTGAVPPRAWFVTLLRNLTPAGVRTGRSRPKMPQDGFNGERRR